MVWVLVALILGSLLFAVSTLMEYKAHLEEVQPRLNRARTSADKLEKGCEVETTRKHEDEEKRAALQKQVSEQKSRVTELKQKIGEAQQEQEALEMEARFESRWGSRDRRMVAGMRR